MPRIGTLRRADNRTPIAESHSTTDPQSEPGAIAKRVAQAKGMVAWTVVGVLIFFLPLRVVTVSVTWTLTELGAASLALGVPDRTPADESFKPLGRVTFFHFRVVT